MDASSGCYQSCWLRKLPVRLISSWHAYADHRTTDIRLVGTALFKWIVQSACDTNSTSLPAGEAHGNFGALIHARTCTATAYTVVKPVASRPEQWRGGVVSTKCTSMGCSLHSRSPDTASWVLLGASSPVRHCQRCSLSRRWLHAPSHSRSLPPVTARPVWPQKQSLIRSACDAAVTRSAMTTVAPAGGAASSV